ncbi:pyridoxal phosphate-dependent aminotransferase [Aestuariivirga sp. YIM B02566]|uniref:Pyridoxal phosphate-dependent aminotransferase n=1 Tax=Taklimakanibacter albus TaxID=2800327 RepID=A0ACC5R7H8_9HYPH|nr:pyridoxal phosphate-dependent aminotransferase [Aestuariivirga sp. YIM B02566]MBK1868584.1 pyridoxal phosphate-dependent aminotransferase [Aestuariivirga sp. YIM B02566]
MRYAKITERLQGLGSEKWAVHIEGKEREAKGEKLIFLSIGEPDAAVPEAIMDVAERQMRAGRTRYSNGRGEPQVLRALSAMYSKRTGRHVAPSQFLFLPGTQTALFVAFMGLIDIGDEVLLPDPYYATYEGVIAAAGGIPVPVRADPDRGFHLSPADLAKKITPRTRALLLNTPGNPTGTVFTADEIASIGALCRKHDLWIVSDEVYATLTYGNTVFVSPFDDAALEERTVVVSSVSKSHAMPGFRCGWIAASEEFCERVLPFSETMLFGSQPFLEDATAFALDNYFPEVEKMKVDYEKRARTLIAGLAGARTVSARMPEGGMFVMVDVRKTGLSGDDFARRLLAEEAVVTMPGESFGEGGAGHLRVALTVDETQIAEASKRIRRLAEQIG